MGHPHVRSDFIAQFLTYLLNRVQYNPYRRLWIIIFLLFFLETDAEVLNEVQEKFEVDITELPEEIDLSSYIEGR